MARLPTIDPLSPDFKGYPDQPMKPITQEPQKLAGADQPAVKALVSQATDTSKPEIFTEATKR
jgi:hypothetical protein